ncbi:MAG: hypothetical protein AAF221_13195 [Pseudomonadota bacterium]
MSSADVFHFFVNCHIVTGAIGLVLFWVPVVGLKGGKAHKVGGKAFTWLMLATGIFAVGISITTLSDPAGTHPHLMTHPLFGSEASIAAIFGWMMIYLAILTVNLAWYGWLCVKHKRNLTACRTPLNLTLQALLLAASINCVVRGILIQQPLMIGMSTIGFATVGTNMWSLYWRKATPVTWLMEHVKALVGTGISVYTAFFAFGAVRILPEAALTPILWSVPLVVGLSIIFYHWWDIQRKYHRRGRYAPSRTKAHLVSAE